MANGDADAFGWRDGNRTTPASSSLVADLAGCLRGGSACVAPVQRSFCSIEGQATLFQPLLYQCATGILSEGQITISLRSMLRRPRKTPRCCLVKRSISTRISHRHGRNALTGARSSCLSTTSSLLSACASPTSGMTSFAEFAPGMKTLDDALTIRRRVFRAFEVAETLPTPEERSEWLTFAIVGAGTHGVELAGQIRELAHRTIAREFPNDPAA